MAIKMPTLGKGFCTQCKHVSDYYFNRYGSTSNCDFCDSAPIHIKQVIA